jgi:hypothetical protein
MEFDLEFYLLNTENRMEWIDIIGMILGGIICILGILFGK